MEFIIKISQFLLSLSLLIVLHELGHFIPARLFKTRVEKFYLFFDIKYSLFKKKIGETEYGIGWLPLGGYVKIAGMIDESMDKEQMALPPKPWEFRAKPAWQRLIIMLGGVAVNFVLALLIYIVMAFTYGDTDISVASIKGGYLIDNPLLTDLGFKTGDRIVSLGGNKVVKYSDINTNLIGAETVTIERDGAEQTISLPEDFLGQLTTNKHEGGLFTLRRPFLIEGVSDTSLNKSADILKGDVVKSINGKSVEYFDQAEDVLKEFKGETVAAEILRDGQTKRLDLQVDESGKLGVIIGGSPDDWAKLGYFDIVRNEYSLGESLGIGFNRFTRQITGYFTQLKMIFSPSTGAYKGVGGFKAIFDVFPSAWSWEYFWGITAFLSIMLGVLNLLPIPALDGGHVMFLLYEMISGRAPSEKFLERAQLVGFVIIIMLVLFANGNDIFKAVTD